MCPNDERRPGQGRRSRSDGTVTIARPTDKAAQRLTRLRPERVGEMVPGVIVEALLAGERAWWSRRADDFEAAKPRPGDYHGNRTPEQLREAWRQMDAIARACRARASLCNGDELRASVESVLEGVAS